MFTLKQWIDGTYAGCNDPTTGRDRENIKVHICDCCSKEKEDCKSIDGDFIACPSCISTGNMFKYYREITNYEITDLELFNIKPRNL